MKRPILALFLAAAGGAWLGWSLDLSPVALLPVLLATVCLPRSMRQLAVWSAVVLVVACATGHRNAASHPIESASGTSATAEVYITKIGRTTERSHTAQGVLTNGEYAGTRVRLRLPAEWAGRVHIGDRVEGVAQFRRMDRFQNDGMFSYAAYLKRRDIHGLLQMDAPKVYAGKPGGALALRRAWTEGMEKATGALFSPREADLLVSVWTGTSHLSEERGAAFRALGLSHLLAVSGLHVGILFAAVRMGVGRFLRKRQAERIALLLLYGYAWILGFPLSVVRATLMVTVLVASKWMRRGYDPVTSLLFAGTLILCLWPGSVTDGGFHLSLAGVSAMVWLRPLLAARRPPKRAWEAAGQAAFAVWVMTAPLLLWHMGEVSPWAIAANALLVPLFSLFVAVALPATLLWFLWPLAAYALSRIAVLPGIAFFAFTDAPAVAELWLWRARWNASAVAWWYAILWMLGNPHRLIGWPRPWIRGVIGASVAAAFAVIVWQAVRPPELLLIDIGQGDAALWTDGGRHILIDTGGERPEALDSAEAALLPSLEREGVRRLDAVFLSHYDMDHTENLGTLLAAVPVDVVIVPAGLSHTEQARQTAALCAQNGVPVREARTGDQWRWTGRTSMDVLYAAEGAYNNDSTVLKVVSNGHTALLPGDLEAPGEERLRGADLRADWLKAGHHGSATSTGDAFLRAVGPRHALISCGFQNPYGHPAPSVLERLQEAGVSVHRTDRQGNLRVAFGNTAVVTAYPTDRGAWRAFAASLPAFLLPMPAMARVLRRRRPETRLPSDAENGVY